MKRLNELADMLTKATGIKHSFAGSNGMFFSASFSPFPYLNGAHSAKDICLYLEGVLSAFQFIK